MTKQEAGRLGGLATVERHGRAHMVELGRLGFAAAARKLCGGSRSAMLGRLVGKGRLKLPRPDLTDAETAELYATVGLSDEECPY